MCVFLRYFMHAFCNSLWGAAEHQLSSALASFDDDDDDDDDGDETTWHIGRHVYKAYTEITYTYDMSTSATSRSQLARLCLAVLTVNHDCIGRLLSTQITIDGLTCLANNVNNTTPVNVSCSSVPASQMLEHRTMCLKVELIKFWQVCKTENTIVGSKRTFKTGAPSSTKC